MTDLILLLKSGSNAIANSVYTLPLMQFPMEVLALTIASGIGFFTLVQFRHSTLRRLTGYQTREKRVERLRQLDKHHEFARLGGWLNAAAVAFTLAWCCYPTAPETVPGDNVRLVTYFAFVAVVFSLVAVGIALASLGHHFVKGERDRLEASLKAIEATVCFRGGRRVRGYLQNLNLLQGHPYFSFLTMNQEPIWIDSAKIECVFLQKNAINDTALAPAMFREGPHNLVLRSPFDEQFKAARWYERSGFRVFPCYKRDTKTRFVIARQSKVDVLIQ
ncbi:MAG: hypothetical protein ABII79_05960 [bacterium]